MIYLLQMVFVFSCLHYPANGLQIGMYAFSIDHLIIGLSNDLSYTHMEVSSVI